MAVGCGPKISKFILFTFNILFWISGLILIVIGAVYLANGTFGYIDKIINSSTNRNTLIAFIVIGAVIFIIGFCGCCGAIKENRFLLGTYIVLLIIIIIVEVGVGIGIAVMKDTIRSNFNNQYKRVVEFNYTEGPGMDSTLNLAVDSLQQGFKCCGYNKSDDWKTSKWYMSQKDEKLPYPKSCCPNKNSTCGKNPNSDDHYPEGCLPMMEQYLDKYFPIVIGVAIGIALFEIFVVICAFCLCRNTDDQRQAV